MLADTNGLLYSQNSCLNKSIYLHKGACCTALVLIFFGHIGVKQLKPIIKINQSIYNDKEMISETFLIIV